MENITYCLNFLAELGVQVDGLGAKGKSHNVHMYTTPVTLFVLLFIVTYFVEFY